MKDVDPSNLFNYDKTNLTDDPASKTVLHQSFFSFLSELDCGCLLFWFNYILVDISCFLSHKIYYLENHCPQCINLTLQVIVRRGQNRVEQKARHSKASTSVMFCANASGRFLPPMVVYKAKNVYPAWIKGAPLVTRFDATKSGWFDASTFSRWFFEILLPQLSGDGPFAVIGDNLGSHFNASVIETCREKNIRFITLPPNSTHLCQPLDVAVFAPMKRVWRSLLEEWRRESRSKGTLPKEHFPLLLSRLVEGTKNANIVSGFRATGIYPQNREAVLKHIMSATNDSLNKSAENLLGPSIVKVLQENLGIGSQQTQRKKTPRGRKITPGKPIESLEEPCSSGKNLTAVFDSNEEAEEDFSVSHIKKGKPTARKSGKVKGSSKLQKGQEWRKKKKGHMSLLQM